MKASHIFFRYTKKRRQLFFTYSKEYEAGITKPRRLWPLHPEWEQIWQLVKRVKRKDPLPKLRTRPCDAFKNI